MNTINLFREQPAMKKDILDCFENFIMIELYLFNNIKATIHQSCINMIKDPSVLMTFRKQNLHYDENCKCLYTIILKKVFKKHNI